jgi:hypothetical protein
MFVICAGCLVLLWQCKYVVTVVVKEYYLIAKIV